MALSNIRNEPRREITEQLIGVAALLSIPFAAHYIATAWIGAVRTIDVVGFTVLLTLMLPIMAALAIGLFYLAHFIGEEICDGLRNMGVDPRPRQRK